MPLEFHQPEARMMMSSLVWRCFQRLPEMSLETSRKVTKIGAFVTIFLPG